MPKILFSSYLVCFVLACAIVWVLSYWIYQAAVSNKIQYQKPTPSLAIQIISPSPLREQAFAYKAHNMPQLPDMLPFSDTVIPSKLATDDAVWHGIPSVSHDMLQYQSYDYPARYIVLHRVEPVYPPHAMRRGIEGVVEIEFTLTRQGKTTNLQVVQSKPYLIFDEAALRAVSQWQYQPIAEEEQRRVRIEFRLDE